MGKLIFRRISVRRIWEGVGLSSVLEGVLGRAKAGGFRRFGVAWLFICVLGSFGEFGGVISVSIRSSEEVSRGRSLSVYRDVFGCL